MKGKFFSLVLLAALACVSSMSAGVAVPQSVPVFMGHGDPSNGDNEIQTLTFDNNITGGSFRLKWGNYATGSIAWSSSSATLATNIQSALRGITAIGNLGVVVSDEDAEVGGHGDFTVTFSGVKVARLDVPELVVIANSLIGTTHTLTVSTNVPGITADGRNGKMGAIYVDCDAGKIWCNTGMPPNIAWVSNTLPLGVAQPPVGHSWFLDAPSTLGGFQLAGNGDTSVVLQEDNGSVQHAAELNATADESSLLLMGTGAFTVPSFVVVANGSSGVLMLRATSLPTSASGLPSGQVWRDSAASNVLKIVP